MSFGQTMSVRMTDEVWLANTTLEDGTLQPGVTELPVLGLPGINFYILHITATVSLGISISASLLVFIILRPKLPSFWTRSIGERFAVYLALGDLLYSISHFADHAWMLAVVWHPPEDVCVVMGFFVATFVFVQSLMVSFMALNAFILVVKETKVSLGRYDWRFLSVTLLGPVVLMTPCAAMRWLGPSGGWCVCDVRKEMGKLLSIVMSFAMLITMIVNIVCYVFVFFKIRKVSTATQAIGASTGGGKYSNTVRVMMKFVAAYIFQWWSHVVYSLWNMMADPPFAVIHLVVFTCNMGGLFNLIAYTLMRRMRTGKTKGNPRMAYVTKSAATSTTDVSLSEVPKSD